MKMVATCLMSSVCGFRPAAMSSLRVADQTSKAPKPVSVTTAAVSSQSWRFHQTERDWT